MSILRGSKQPKLMASAVKVDSRAPDIMSGPGVAVFVNSEVSVLVVPPWPMLILFVLSASRFAQIAKAIVKRVAVDVINFIRWPVASHVQPREAMSSSFLPADANGNVSALRDCASGAEFGAIASPNEACENAGSRLVVENLAQLRGGKINLSHEAVLSLIGQRLGSVSALAEPRHFTGSLIGGVP